MYFTLYIYIYIHIASQYRTLFSCCASVVVIALLFGVDCVVACVGCASRKNIDVLYIYIYIYIHTHIYLYVYIYIYMY